MRRFYPLAVALPLLVAAVARAAEPQFSVELNEGKSADGKCQLTFVTENKTGMPVDTFKLDLVLFDRDNRVSSRMVTEMGPLRPSKTVVKTYSVEGDCANVRSILVNDVPACAPAKHDDCVDGLVLSSRIDGVRFFK